jgi:hypothetical protein
MAEKVSNEFHFFKEDLFLNRKSYEVYNVTGVHIQYDSTMHSESLLRQLLSCFSGEEGLRCLFEMTC